jgi:DNA-binding response OmpR family regulator
MWANPPIRILHVDDDALVAAVVEAMLKPAGFTVTWSPNASDALEAAARGTFDLYLLDVALPGMRGDHLAEYLSRATPDVPIVFLTGDREAVEGAPAAAVVTKPFSGTALVRAVEAALEAAATGSARQAS